MIQYVSSWQKTNNSTIGVNAGATAIACRLVETDDYSIVQITGVTSSRDANEHATLLWLGLNALRQVVEIDQHNYFDKNAKNTAFEEEIIRRVAPILEGGQEVGAYSGYQYRVAVESGNSGWAMVIVVGLTTDDIGVVSADTPTPTMAATHTPTPTTRVENKTTSVPTKAPTATPTIRNTPTPISVNTPTPTPIPTFTPTPEPTYTPTPTPEPTSTPTPTPAPTSTPTPTPLPEYVTFSEAQILEMMPSSGWQGDIDVRTDGDVWYEGNMRKAVSLIVKTSRIYVGRDIPFQHSKKIVVEFNKPVVAAIPWEYHEYGHQYTIEGNRVIITSSKDLHEVFAYVFLDDDGEESRVKSITIYTK